MKNGYLRVICGPMFSGKTSELLRRLERLDYARKKYVLFKPKFDNRYSENEVVSHTKKSKKSILVNNAQEIIEYLDKHNDIVHVAIDETQFFKKSDKPNLIDIILKMKSRGINIMVNGLDLDSEGKPFSIMPDLMALSDEVIKLKAVCMFPGCGEDAGMSYKKSKVQNKEAGNVVELGESESYEARCYFHWLLKD
jgi:thymidine kinase